MLSAFFFFTLPAVASAQAETARVRHVLDGDSFILADGRQARLIGVNAPELGKAGAPGQPLAKQAHNRLSRLIKGQTLTLSRGREPQDHYGRWLVHARLPDGASVEEILLREGLAWAIAIPPNLDRLDSLLKAENEARAAGRGVWGEAAYAPKPAGELTARDTGFRFIEGTIQRHARGRRVIYFDLAPQVALVVSHEEWKKYFGGKPTDLVGRNVVARGWLTEKREKGAGAEPRTPSTGRLHLRVPHPAMLTWRD
ncbi:MAG TPA: thermonuclease family protein [Sulfuricaulis sp.]|nr:thermonuclease family protein [Sulfuricaulis sp.]